MWIVDPSLSMLDPESRTVYVVGGLFLVLMVIGVFLSWKIRKSHQAENDNPDGKNTDSPMDQSMSTLGTSQPPPPPIQQKVNNNYNNQPQSQLSQSSHHHQPHQQQQPAMTMVQHQYQNMHPSSSASFVHQMVRGPPQIMNNPGIPGSFQ